MSMKVHLNLSLNESIVTQCRDKGLNISALCEDSLREILKTFDNQVLPENCKHKWCLPFSAASGLMKECLKCGDLKKIKIESYELTIARANKLSNSK